MIGGYPRYQPADKVVDGCNDVLLAQPVLGEGAKNVDGPLFEGFHGFDGQKRLGGVGFGMFFLHSTHVLRRS